MLTPQEAGIDELPGRDGSFGRSLSFAQMELDARASGVETEDDFLSELVPSPASDDSASRAGEAARGEQGGRIKWCRRCELACPVGS